MKSLHRDVTTMRAVALLTAVLWIAFMLNKWIGGQPANVLEVLLPLPLIAVGLATFGGKQ